MAGLYANQMLQGNLDKVGTVDRFPRIGVNGGELMVTLAIGTAPSGHVQVIMSLDLVQPDGMAVIGTPLAAYPMAMQDLAYADAMLVALKLGLDIRRADTGRGWVIDGNGDRESGRGIVVTGTGG